MFHFRLWRLNADLNEFRKRVDVVFFVHDILSFFFHVKLYLALLVVSIFIAIEVVIEALRDLLEPPNLAFT